jgi:hypothetical protein
VGEGEKKKTPPPKRGPRRFHMQSNAGYFAFASDDF